MRWISDKTGLAVSQVEPQALVRLEVDEPAVATEVVRIFEEPEQVLGTLLKRLGRHYRRPVTTLRWDLQATTQTIGLRTQAWHAVQLPPPETPTRLAAQITRRRSPPLFVGGPVQLQLELTHGLDGHLGVPIVAGLEASAGARKTRNLELSATAYGAIDPLVSIRALTHMDETFGEHFLRAIEETSARYLVAPSVMHNAWHEVLSGFEPMIAVQSETVELHIEEGTRRQFSLRLYDVPRHPFPLVLGVFDRSGRLMSMSELGVVAD